MVHDKLFPEQFFDRRKIRNSHGMYGRRFLHAGKGNVLFHQRPAPHEAGAAHRELRPYDHGFVAYREGTYVLHVRKAVFSGETRRMPGETRFSPPEQQATGSLFRPSASSTGLPAGLCPAPGNDVSRDRARKIGPAPDRQTRSGHRRPFHPADFSLLRSVACCGKTCKNDELRDALCVSGVHFFCRDCPMEELILHEIVVLFILSIIVVLVCLRFRLPSIVGFLLTGVLCGPSALGLIPSPEAVDTMADVGVAFLMFSIGMELSGKELVRLKKPLFIGGSLQVLLTMAFVFALTFWWCGPRLGIVYGCMVTLSSTAIVLSILQQKALVESPQGQVCLAVLIFQDLAIVPMVLIFPLLSGGLELDTNSMLLAVGKGVLVIGGILLFGKYLLHRLMFSVVSTRSRELMLMTTLGLCLAVALITSWLGLSLALGAFLAGLMMAESEYSLNTLESIMPFKEVFSSRKDGKEKKILTTFSIEPSFKRELEELFDDMGLGWAGGIRFALKEFAKKYSN